MPPATPGKVSGEPAGPREPGRIQPPVQKGPTTRPATTQPAPSGPENAEGQSPGRTTPAEPKGYQPCPPGFDLTCILKSGPSHWAIINGQIVDVGQTVNGAKVIRISPEAAVMELNGKQFILHIGQRSGEAPAKAGETDQPPEDAPKESATKESGTKE
jgi:hypothetical protein